jgi:hypothetical protein
MAEPLAWEDALRLARSLKTIKGFAWDEANIEATAADLVGWCRGYVTANRVWSPQDQALDAVTAARHTWVEWTGAADLHALILAKFPPKARAVDFVPASEQDLVRRGLLCGKCFGEGKFDGDYCTCNMGRAAKRWDAHNPAPAPVKPNVRPIRTTNLDQLLRDGQRLWEDEQRRKREQLEAAGIDTPGDQRRAS